MQTGTWAWLYKERGWGPVAIGWHIKNGAKFLKIKKVCLE
jgi:hypothetical protein